MSKIPLLYHDRRMEGLTPTRQAQLIELHLLEVFKRICDEHKIHYWLNGGTLLGALRHGGPIPWDDDLDVMILEEEYDLFLFWARQELPVDVYLETPSDSLRMENHITRLRDNYSIGLIKREKRLLINDHHGVSIDIFPIRRMGNDCVFAKKTLRRLASVYGYYKRAHYNEATTINVIKKWIWGCRSLFYKTILELTQLGHTKKYLVEASWFQNEKLWWPTDWLLIEGQAPRTVMFDGVLVNIPYESEKILEQEFGDWRQMPPPEQRVGYLSLCLPTTPCFHPKAMVYPTGEQK